MKWFSRIVVMAFLGLAIGCSSGEVAPVTESVAPSDDMMKSMAEESMKNMPKAQGGGVNPNQAKMEEMMKKATESAPGDDPPSQ